MSRSQSLVHTAAALMLLVTVPCIAQSPDDAYLLMAKKEYRAAIKAFSVLCEENPGVADYWRSIGWCYYRASKFDQAVDALDKSLKLEPFAKTDNKIRGKAYYSLGDNEEAIADLEQYLTSFSHDTPTRLILAVAYKRDGQLGKAEKELARVAKDSPTLAPAAQMHLADIAANKGDAKKTADLFADVRGSIGGLAMQEQVMRKINLLEDRMTRVAEGDKERKWRASASCGLEYSDNIMFIGDEDITSKELAKGGDASIYLTASGKYKLIDKGPHSLDLSANLYANKYFSKEGADVLKISPKIAYLFTGLNTWKLQSKLGLDEMMVDGASSVRSIYFSQKAVKSWGLRMSTALQYILASNQYDKKPSVAEDRDGMRHTLQGTQFFRFNEGRRASVGALYKINSTDGDEFDSSTIGVKASYSHNFFWDTRMSYNGGVNLTGYDNASVYSPAGDTTERSDQSYKLSVRCSKALSARLSADLAVAFSLRNSNIANYDYNENSISPSLTYVF